MGVNFLPLLSPSFLPSRLSCAVAAILDLRPLLLSYGTGELPLTQVSGKPSPPPADQGWGGAASCGGRPPSPSLGGGLNLAHTVLKSSLYR